MAVFVRTEHLHAYFGCSTLNARYLHMGKSDRVFGVLRVCGVRVVAISTGKSSPQMRAIARDKHERGRINTLKCIRMHRVRGVCFPADRDSGADLFAPLAVSFGDANAFAPIKRQTFHVCVCVVCLAGSDWGTRAIAPQIERYRSTISN